MMRSEDYKERFKAEYYQLKIRYNGLKKMMEKWEAGTLEFEPTCDKETYEVQLSHMKSYLGVLQFRAKSEKIELAEED